MAQFQEIYVDAQTGQPISLPNQSPPSYIPTQIKSDKADMIDKIQPEDIVDKIRHKLMGEELINGKWIKNTLFESRAITEIGAWEIASIMLGVSSKNVALSKLSDDEIRNRTVEIVRTVQHMCIKNWLEYGIKGTDQLEFIHQIVMSNTFITLKQPEGAGIRELIKGTVQENRTYTNQEEPRKRFRLWPR